MRIVLYILLFILILGLVVCIHELGHYFWAKKANIYVGEFAFGMGPKLFSKKKGETAWSIRAFPIGGFCAMNGETEEEPRVKPDDKVKIHINDNGLVDKIYLENKKFYPTIDLEEIIVSDVCLLSKDGEELHINEYKVDAYAELIYTKNQTIPLCPYDRTYMSKTPLQRLLVCFGGPLNNLLLGIVVFLILAFIMGVPSTKTTLGGVDSGSPASGLLEKGDTITKINDNPVSEFSDIGVELYNCYNDSITITYTRGGSENTVTVYPYYAFLNLGFASDMDRENKNEVSIICETPAAMGGTQKTAAYTAGLRNGDIITYIIYNGTTHIINSFEDIRCVNESYIDGGSIVVGYLRDGVEGETESYSIYSNNLLAQQGYSVLSQKTIGISAETSFDFFKCIRNGFIYFGNAALIIFNTLIALVSSKEVSVKDLGGFLTILNTTAEYAQGGITSILYWIGLLSVNLGIMNLLPIPALDGGRILFTFIEVVFRKKINPKVESIIINVFFWLLMIFIGYIFFQDILREIAIFK